MTSSLPRSTTRMNRSELRRTKGLRRVSKKQRANVKFKRTPKGYGCYGICRDDLIDILRRGGVLRWGKFGPMIDDPADTGRDADGRWIGHAELHPRRDTCRNLQRDGLISRDEEKTTEWFGAYVWSGARKAGAQ